MNKVCWCEGVRYEQVVRVVRDMVEREGYECVGLMEQYRNRYGVLIWSQKLVQTNWDLLT